MRPDLDHYFMEMAKVASTRGTCDRKKVGCVITQKDRIIAAGYNGAPPGVRHCHHGEFSVDECSVSEHAEWNAIVHGTTSLDKLMYAVLYTTMAPCLRCARMMLHVGIARVVYLEKYRDPAGLLELRYQCSVVQL